MSENRDPGIKLFGATIQVQGNEGENLVEEVADRGADDEGGEDEQKENLELEATVSKDKDQEDAVSDEQAETPTSSSKEDLSKDLVKEKENLNEEKHSKLEGEQLENNPPQEKTLKKPDKILPCPRCNSKDTKFCYYNNYNVNQPRHFCKNCQRYWTDGGTMRNVPVGAGRRKNKSASHYRQIMPTESTQTVQSENSSLKSSGTVLSFGSDSPLCESLASVLITDKGIRNGFHQVEDQRIQVLCVGENGEEQSNGSSLTASNSTEEGNGTNLSEPMSRNCNAMPPIPCFTAAPWPYPWNLAQLSSAFPPPAFCTANFPVPFYPPAPYWGCPMPSAWTIPWPVQPPSSSPKPKFPGSNPNSPTLGKHLRDGTPANTIDPEKEESIKENGSERSLWIPKTLRIDDPGEAAKSSIWATLGIKNDKTDTSPGSMFKAFQPKMQQKKNHSPETSPVLQANPAALSRSINFHENS